MHPLIHRGEIAQAAFDRFNGKPFDWGQADCIQLAKFTAMRAGYSNPLRGTRPYAGQLGAVRAMRTALTARKLPVSGNLGDLLDAAGFARIAPAACLPGDFVGMAAEAPFGFALSVAMGNGKALAFALHPESVDQRAFVGEMFSTQPGVESPAVTAWSLF